MKYGLYIWESIIHQVDNILVIGKVFKWCEELEKMTNAHFFPYKISVTLLK